jgi:hypothetical protein
MHFKRNRPNIDLGKSVIIEQLPLINDKNEPMFSPTKGKVVSPNRKNHLKKSIEERTALFNSKLF